MGLDHKVTAKIMQFLPPPPMSMDAYLDQITNGQVEATKLLTYIDKLETALRLINLRPTEAEKGALLTALETRYYNFGVASGYVTPLLDANDKDRANVFLTFIVEDILHIKPTARSAAVDALKEKLKEIIVEALNNTGKISLAFLNLLYDLCTAKSAEDVEKTLIGFSYMGLGALVKKYWQSGLKSAMKFAQVSPVVRNRVIKFIAARLTWINIAFDRLAWAFPLLLAIDVFLTSEDTATDEQEARLAFLVQYGRVVDSRDYVYARVVRSIEGPEWQFNASPVELLQAKIQRM
jgi:hypothetical protein